MNTIDWNLVLEQTQHQLSNDAKPLLKLDGEPFTQADLLFEQPVSEQLDADQDGDVEALKAGETPRLCYQGESAHWHVTEAPDGFYYLKEGMDPPRDSLGFYRGLWGLIEYWVPFAMIIVFVLIMLVVKK